VPCRRTHVVPWSWINSSPAGALIIDPTTNAATNEDVRLYDAGNYGTDTKLAVGKFPNTGNWKSRSIINFSLTGIPSNATVLNAQMKLKYYEKYNNTTGTWVDRWIQAHQLLLGWDEAQADSLERSTGVNWAAARGKIGGTNPDANGAYESTLLIVEDEALPVWKSWDLTALTQKWVSGTVANYGVLLWATNENTSGYVLRFYSSEATTTSDRPYLEVIWSQTPQTVYFLKDHLGSIRAAVSDSGKAATVIGFDDYDPWGYPLVTRTKAIPNAYLQGASKSKFTGHEYDDDLGLDWIHTDRRPYIPAIGRWMVVEPLWEKYPSYSPYIYTLNNPLKFIDKDGQDVFVALTGGATGGGKIIKPENAGTTGQIFLAAQERANQMGVEFSGATIASGFTSGSSVENAIDFIKSNYTQGEKLIIYGYSNGGDYAVELAGALGEIGINVDLLITVDASDGPTNATVDRTIPANVGVNYNILQTNDSGASSGSQSSGSRGSNSGSSNSPGSSGGRNKAANPKTTKVINRDVTAKGTTHGNIDERYRDAIINSLFLIF